MIQLNCSGLKKNFGGQTVFTDVSFVVKSGENIGFIGRNGTGKTTVFKIIAGLETQDEGHISMMKNASLGYLHQIPDYPDKTSVEDVINEAFAEIFSKASEIKRYEKALSDVNNPDYDSILEKLGTLQTEYEHAGGYDIEYKKDKILSGFKFTNDFRKRQFMQLSGGEKTIVMLARMLLQSPDILLLDEPTNHLDIDAVEWLEGYLADYDGSTVIISHDRYFLDRVCSRIVELEFGKTVTYSGNYSFYQQEKDLRIKQEFEAYKDRQKKIKALRAAAERYRVWGRINTDNNAHMARAKRYEKMADELEEQDRPQTAKSMNFNLKSGTRSGKRVITAEKMSMRFDKKLIFDNIDFLALYQEKTALLGKNGSGKTTFFKLVMGDLKPESGICELGASVKVGYLEQEIEFSDESRSILDLYQRKFNLYENEARTRLARFLFTRDEVFKTVKDLSGGEKVRLRLCFLLSQEINLLMLDEPTNHLDIASRELLEESLAGFEGTILFISHDRYFINKLADRICSIENRKIVSYNGNYDYYKKKISERNLQKKPLVSIKKKDSREDNKEELRKQRKLDKLQEEIEKVESDILKLEQEMITHGSDYEKLTELMDRKSEFENNLEALFEKWAEMEEG